MSPHTSTHTHTHIIVSSRSWTLHVTRVTRKGLIGVPTMFTKGLGSSTSLVTTTLPSSPAPQTGVFSHRRWCIHGPEDPRLGDENRCVRERTNSIGSAYRFRSVDSLSSLFGGSVSPPRLLWLRWATTTRRYTGFDFLSTLERLWTLLVNFKLLKHTQGELTRL